MVLLKKIKENAYLRNIIIFFSVMGPGIITGSVDNDAGGITTYSVAGAVYGYQSYLDAHTFVHSAYSSTGNER